MAIRDDLFAWLTKQPLWQQDLARRLAERSELAGEEYHEALRMVKRAFGALADEATAPEPRALNLEDLPAGADSSDTPRLIKLGQLRGVGAATPSYELRFLPTGLTVIYGQNGAGKTTYVRALKKLCRAVDSEVVRGNVFAQDAQPAKPTAKIEYTARGETEGRQVALDAPSDLGLDSISVFDSRCAELYVDATNTVAYIPSGLRLLARLAATQDQMRTDLATEIEHLKKQLPSFSDLPEGTTARTLVEELAPTSDFEDVEKFAAITEAEAARLGELRAALDSAARRSTQEDAAAAKADKVQADNLAQRLRELTELLSESSLAELRAKALDAKTAREALDLAAKEFAGLPVKGVGGEAWRVLWQTAREFAESSSRLTFPPALGERCPLCLQVVDGETASRMARFEQHVKSAVQERAATANQDLATALARFKKENVEACRTAFLESLRERQPELHAALDALLVEIAEHFDTLAADPTAQVAPVSDKPINTLADWANSREKHADTLTHAADPEKERALKKELAELEARAKLASRLPDVSKRLRLLSRIEALSRAHRALATNRITTTQRQLAEQAVTGALATKLKEELANLHCTLPVDLEPHTRVGKTEVSLRLSRAQGSPRVSEIASEGEQRALSLAFFFAEVATSEHNGGIIVDDPVSSLDDERRDHIAKRLVEEAAHRQVIVFTHDLPFLLDLQQQARDAGLEPLVQHVWRLGKEVGRIDSQPPFKAMKFPERLGVLTREVEQWDKQNPPRDFDEAWRRVSDFYKRLRTAWERAVEEGLFKGVVQRFQREVKTLALDKVVINDDLKRRVKEGMSRCSMFVHDEPPATHISLPDRTQLAEDVEKLRDFWNLTKQLSKR